MKGKEFRNSKLLRREKTVKRSVLQVADLILDPATHEVTRGDRVLDLTSKEYRLLDYFMRRPGQVCTRTMIGEHIWGYNFIDSSNVIDVSVSNLRRKVDGDNPVQLVKTVRNVGYKIVKDTP